MGDNVGQMFYGVYIGDTDDKEFEPLFGIETSSDWEVNRKNPTSLVTPYETPDAFLVISETDKSAYNGGRFIGKQLESKPEWDEMLIARAKELNLEINLEEIGWFLVGHYG